MPPVSSNEANTRTYPSTIHWSSLTPAPSSRLIVGSATLTTVLSSIAIASAKHIVNRTMTFSRAFSPSKPNIPSDLQGSTTSRSLYRRQQTTRRRGPIVPVYRGSGRLRAAVGADAHRVEEGQETRHPGGRLPEQGPQRRNVREQPAAALGDEVAERKHPDQVHPDRHRVVLRDRLQPCGERLRRDEGG